MSRSTIGPDDSSGLFPCVGPGEASADCRPAIRDCLTATLDRTAKRAFVFHAVSYPSPCDEPRRRSGERSRFSREKGAKDAKEKINWQGPQTGRCWYTLLAP